MIIHTQDELTQHEIWFQLLFRIDGLNRRVKEPGWSCEDKQKVYHLKDTVLKRLLTERPEAVQLQLYYVPYYKYSEICSAGKKIQSLHCWQG